MIQADSHNMNNMTSESGKAGRARLNDVDKSRTTVETEYVCGCTSHETHAPEKCPVHGEAISLTRIIVATLSKQHCAGSVTLPHMKGYEPL